MSGRIEELERVRAFIRAHRGESATHTQLWRGGTAFFHEGLPLVYDLNYMVLEKDQGTSAKEIADEADELMGPQLGHRRLIVDDEDAGQRLTPAFRDLGWKDEVHVIMALHREPDRRADTSEVQEFDEQFVWPSREEFLRTYEWCNDDETASQLHVAYRIWMRAGNGRDLGIVRDGKAVSFAMLWNDGATAQIEDVATLEPYRNQGLSRSVIGAAMGQAREEGCDLVFLIADEADWPRELYTKLGFDVIGRYYYFAVDAK